MTINLNTWYDGRQVDVCPKHFVRAQTELDEEKQFWVLEKLSGRFHIKDNKTRNLFFYDRVIYFEDPHEAVVYELTWS